MDTKLAHISGDVTNISPNNNTIIPHICNDQGLWGRGFVLALDRKWPEPKMAYTHKSQFKLGSVGIVKVDDNIHVANMIAQHRTGRNRPRPPIRYGYLTDAMRQVAKLCREHKADIACPKFGSGLAGGNWHIIEQMIYEIWIDNNIKVTVYAK